MAAVWPINGVAVDVLAADVQGPGDIVSQLSYFPPP